MEDFWNGSATFQYVRQQKQPSIGGGPTSGVFYNITAQITVVGGTWYRFAREAIIERPHQVGCDADVRMVLHKSTDQGATWTGRTVVVDPKPGTDYECAGTDGSVFYDASKSTWHALYQCIENKPGATWGVCHASRQNADPIGPWTLDPKKSVARGDILQKLMGMSGWFDEGTPHIVEKVGEWFYATFHGYNGAGGVRVLARTTDFKTWVVDRTTPIFSASDCAGWNVPWKGGCLGAGWADTYKENGYYYLLPEAVDLNLSCVNNQNWVFGLVRSLSITQPQWQHLPGGSAILFNSKQPDPRGNVRPCGLQHGLLFRSGSDLYLSVNRIYNDIFDTPSSEDHPGTGRYYYKLVKGGPVASYSFREGVNGQTVYALSDSVSRGDLEARVYDTAWLNPGLGMNGMTSVVVLPDNPVLRRSAPWTLEVALTPTAAPSAKSSLIAGAVGSAWLERYPNGDICALAFGGQGLAKACAPLPNNVSATVALAATQQGIILAINGTVKATAYQTDIPQLGIIKVGSSGPDSSGNYGSWKGTLSRVAFHDYATHSATIVPVQNTSCSLGGQSVQNNMSVVRYLASSVPYGSTCISEVRICSNGALSGSYTATECAVLPAPPLVYEAEGGSLGHQNGRTSGNGWTASPPGDAPGYLAFGPYATDWGAAEAMVTFDLMIDSTAGDEAVANIDVYDATSGTVLASTVVRRPQFVSPNLYRSFSLPVSLIGREGHTMEARVYWTGTTTMWLDKIVVQRN